MAWAERTRRWEEPARVRACLRAAMGENGPWIWFGFRPGMGQTPAPISIQDRESCAGGRSAGVCSHFRVREPSLTRWLHLFKERGNVETSRRLERNKPVVQVAKRPKTTGTQPTPTFHLHCVLEGREKPSPALCAIVVAQSCPSCATSRAPPWVGVFRLVDPVVLARRASLHHRLISGMPPACVHKRPHHRCRQISKA